MLRCSCFCIPIVALLAGCASMTGADFNESLKTLSDAYSTYTESKKKDPNPSSQPAPPQAYNSPPPQAYNPSPPQAYNPPPVVAPRPIAARYCRTQLGYCNMAVALPPNASCVCYTPRGAVQGFTQ